MPRSKIITIGDVDIKVERELSHLDLWKQGIQNEAKKEVLDLETLQLRDIKNKIENREKLKNFLIWLLICQNILVFLIVVISLYFDKIKDLQMVFSV